MKSSLLFGAVAAVVCFAPGAMALSPAEVEQRAKAVSVEMLTGEGSGVIIHRQDNLYTVITNRHVVCTVKKLCTDRDVHHSYRLKTSDGRIYQVSKSNIKLLKDSAGKPLDLAIVQFRSGRSYPVAQVAEPGRLKVNDAVYTAGFPPGRGWLFGTGQAQAVVNRRLAGDKGGYTVVYNAETLPGMSGGGAFDRDGRLVAVHGQGDRYTENTQAEVVSSNRAKAAINSKTGYNRGIPVRWVVQGLSNWGILLGGSKPLPPDADKAATNADEFFIVGFNKLVDPGQDFQAGKQEAVKQFSQAIALNPRYVVAYFMRAHVKDDLNDPQGALADYNQAISLDPEFATAYNNRGLLKYEKLNDPQGALADYNQAISLNPQYAIAYNNRGNLKDEKLNDPQGALADFNQAIFLNPKDAIAYNNRGLLKYEKLNNPQGALGDYNQSISLNPKLAPAYNNRGNLKTTELNDPQGALADYTLAISLDPKDATAYNNRGNLKKNELNDPQGALADYTLAISLNPQYATAFYNRAILKVDKLNDPQGALADYNLAISLNPQYATAYGNRAILKYQKLNDRAGAIADLRIAAKLFRAQGRTQDLQKVTDILRSIGVIENP
jgi:tetratricopeptide (TPR) repeat protein/V8-like Glu-specific endopeptidase